jgi:hypothetical protein
MGTWRSKYWKKLHTCRSKKKIIINLLPCPYVFQIKDRDIHERSVLFLSSTFQTHAQSWSTRMICHLHGSNFWFAIYICVCVCVWERERETSACFQISYHELHISLPLEVGWKEALPWRGHIHTK